MSAPSIPIFDFTDHFDSHITIGEHQLPIKVKRFSRGEMEIFQKQWWKFFAPKGAGLTAIVTQARDTVAAGNSPTWLQQLLAVIEVTKPHLEGGAELEAFDADMKRFMEESIREAITIDPGYIRDKGKDVVDGDGFIGAFHSRRDVLSDLLFRVWSENNLLAGPFRKNSKSPLASVGGSAPSVPAPGGDRQEPTAGSAATSTSVPSADATDENNPIDEDARASSGPHHASEEPKIH